MSPKEVIYENQGEIFIFIFIFIFLGILTFCFMQLNMLIIAELSKEAQKALKKYSLSGEDCINLIHIE